MSVQLITSIEEMQLISRQWHRAGLRIAFVPTMGSLHAGHLKLVEQAKANADRVVVSIFVNPLQFGAGEDFDKYPRTLAADMTKLNELAVDIVFSPEEKTFYTKEKNLMSFVEVPGLSDILCGASRPGHFRGVTTVVNKLFNIVQADIAVFGTKDYQQFAIIQQMVSDLSMPIELVGVETVREADGLALSSRNAYLSESHRTLAPELYKSLQKMREQLIGGELDYRQLEQQTRQQLLDAGFKVDYLEIRDAVSLARPDGTSQGLVILTAVWLGETRLIDNIII
ncbi:MAG: pantoate--beta-alanine ligase [Gammaproteobacteria bacterium]|nr:pantoate--beta-alanine ligase [Gammaproteobacteria bacterium]